MIKITDKDHGLNAFIKRIKALGSGLEARVGIQGPAARDKGDRGEDSLSNVELFTVHEYGSEKAGIPQRSSLRSTADEGEKKYRGMLRDGMRDALLNRGDPKRVLHKVGETFRADVIARIKAGITPPNTPATLARKKGETTPLIDTGSMIGAISVHVAKHGSG